MSDRIVKRDIPFGSAFAYRRGQLVSADAVKANGWEEYVVGPDTQEGQAVRAEFFPELAEKSVAKKQES